MLSLSRRLLIVPAVLLLIYMASLVRSSSRLSALRLRPSGFTHARQFAPIGQVEVPSPIRVSAGMGVVDVAVPSRSFFTTNKHTQLDLTNMGAKDAVNAAISADKVVVFSKSYCPYCKKAKATLESLNAGAKVYELDEFDEGSDWQAILAEKSGQSTVPSIWINGVFIGGNSDLQTKNSNGELKKLLAQ